MHFPAAGVEHHEHWQCHFDCCRPRCIKFIVKHPNVIRIVGESVGGTDEEVNQEEKEMSMIFEADTVHGKHAVMISLKDADTARVTMP